VQLGALEAPQGQEQEGMWRALLQAVQQGLPRVKVRHTPQALPLRPLNALHM
jgi:hypothetical protein